MQYVPYKAGKTFATSISTYHHVKYVVLMSRIEGVCVYFINGCSILSAKLMGIPVIGFHELTAGGYRAPVEWQNDIISIWNKHPDWRIGHTFYYCDKGKIPH